jgi:hypothetical protein
MLRSEHPAEPWPRLAGGTGSALGFAGAIVATLLGWALGVGTHPQVGLVPLAGVAVCVGATTTLPGALSAAAQCWGMYSGFELHRFGELRLDGPSRAGLVLLVVLGVAASLLGRVAAEGGPARAAVRRAGWHRGQPPVSGKWSYGTTYHARVSSVTSRTESRHRTNSPSAPPGSTGPSTALLGLSQPPPGRRAG